MAPGIATAVTASGAASIQGTLRGSCTELDLFFEAGAGLTSNQMIAPPVFPSPGDTATYRRCSSGTRIASSVRRDRKSTRLNSSHVEISYAVFCLKKKKNEIFK